MRSSSANFESEAKDQGGKNPSAKKSKQKEQRIWRNIIHQLDGMRVEEENHFADDLQQSWNIRKTQSTLSDSASGQKRAGFNHFRLCFFFFVFVFLLRENNKS